jgi:hypothetical protein
MALTPRATHVLQWRLQRVATLQSDANLCKGRLSSDRGLQLGPVKLESLVIAHQQWRGEYVPGPCTHRPSSHGSRGDLKPVSTAGQGKTGNWG